MAQLKDTTAQSLKSLAAPVEPEDVVRKQEHDADHGDHETRLSALEALPPAHAPVTVENTNRTVALELAGQELSADVVLSAETTIQEDEVAVEQVFDHPVAAEDDLDLQRIYVSNLLIVRRNVGGADIATGEDGVDYFLDAESGMVTIPNGSNLITEGGGEEVVATFDCALVKDGPGLIAQATGLLAGFGTAHHQVARGDHTHANDHRPLTTADTPSLELIVDQYQKVAGNVLLAGGGGLKIDGGLAIDTDVVALKSVTDDHENRLAALEGAAPSEGESTTVDDTDTIDLEMDSNGKITGSVKFGSGLQETPGVGLEVNYDEVAAKEHAHAVATEEQAGFMPAEAVTQLADHETRIESLETNDQAQDGRLDAVEAKDTEQDGRLDAVEAKDTEQDGRLNALEQAPQSGNWHVAGSQAAMLALEAIKGDYCRRTDIGQTFALTDDDPAVLANWKQVSNWTGMVLMETIAISDPTESNHALDSTLVVGRKYRIQYVKGGIRLDEDQGWQMGLYVLNGAEGDPEIGNTDQHETVGEVTSANDCIYTDFIASGTALTMELQDIPGAYGDNVAGSPPPTFRLYRYATLEEQCCAGCPDDGLDADRIGRIDTRDFDDEVREILVDGDTWWFAGAFTRFGQFVAPRIAKLDALGRFDPFFKADAGFDAPTDFLARAAGAIIAGGEDGTFGGSGTARPLWKVNDDGTLNTGFTCPTTPSTVGNDRVLGTVMFGTKVALVTERQLIILNADGTVDQRIDATSQLNSVLAHGAGLLVTSHAYSAANQPQRLGLDASPKGAKLLNNSLALDTTWKAADKAGTGAQSSCGRAILGHDGTYFVIGNSRAYFNSPSTAWNAEMIGNLLLWSEEFQQAEWATVGALTVTADDANDPNSNLTADKIEDDSDVSHAYVHQDVAIADDANRYVFSVHVKKDAVTNRFPLIRLQFTGGVEVDLQVQLNTSTGASLIIGNLGGGLGAVTVEDKTTYWRIKLALSNTAAGNTNARCTIYPAYADTFGGSSESLEGFIHAWGAQLRRDDWNDTYQITTDEQFLPDNQGSNSNRFRGLYKVGTDGEEDPTFDCRIELSEAGHVIPFGADSQGRIYIGGPISQIYNAANQAVNVTPWRLYRLTANGKFDKEFAGFNHDVLVARVIERDYLLVGGRFTKYAHKNVGYWIALTPDGEIVDFCCGADGEGGVSESTHTVSAAGTTTLTPGSTKHAARMEVQEGAGPFNHAVVLDDGWAEGQTVHLLFDLPAVAARQISVLTGTDEILAFETDGDGQALTARVVWRDGAWALDGLTRLDGERKVNRRGGDVMEGFLHFPLAVKTQADLVPVDLNGPKFVDVVATDDVVLFTANRADGPMRRVFVRLKADNVGGVSLGFANGIVILGDAVVSIADDEHALVELQSYGASESMTIAIVHGQVAVGSGGPGGGDDGPSDTPPGGASTWMANFDIAGDSYTGAGVVGSGGDYWNDHAVLGGSIPNVLDTGQNQLGFQLTSRLLTEDDYQVTATLEDLGQSPACGFPWLGPGPDPDALQSSHEHPVMQEGARMNPFSNDSYFPTIPGSYSGSFRTYFQTGFRLSFQDLPTGNYRLFVLGGAHLETHTVRNNSVIYQASFWPLCARVGGEDVAVTRGAGGFECTYNPAIATSQFVLKVQYEYFEFTVNTAGEAWLDVLNGVLYGAQLLKLS